MPPSGSPPVNNTGPGPALPVNQPPAQGGPGLLGGPGRMSTGPVPMSGAPGGLAPGSQPLGTVPPGGLRTGNQGMPVSGAAPAVAPVQIPARSPQMLARGMQNFTRTA